MAVQSHDPNEERYTGPAVFSARRLARQQTGFERFVAILLLVISLAGSILAGGGGSTAWLAGQPILWGAGAALVLQGVLSYVQWIYAVYGFHAWQYMGAVLLSSALTVGGFWQLVWPWLVAQLAGLKVPTTTAQVAAGALLVLVALAIDVFPEKTLVRS